MRKRTGALLCVSVLLFLAGCESSPTEGGGKLEEASPDNELFIYTVWPAYYVKEETFEKQVGQFIKKKFPDLKFKHVHWDNPGRQYQDLIVQERYRILLWTTLS